MSADNLSFYVMIDQLKPDYQHQAVQHGSHGFWSPPNIKSGYTQTTSALFHWRGGTMTHLTGQNNALGQVYSTATIFTQNPDTPHLLVVPFNALLKDASQNPGGWRPLSFRHVPVDNSRRTYSAVLANGDCQHIAAPGSTHWMPQLLPRVYDDQSRSTMIQAGLIGSIPLLIALAAFSAPLSFLPTVFPSCVRPQQWLPHQHQYPTGHTAERGMVVTIFMDAANAHGSNLNKLYQLEYGHFGPFYS